MVTRKTTQESSEANKGKVKRPNRDRDLKSGISQGEFQREFPEVGDIIQVTWNDHRTRHDDGIDRWHSGLVYRESFEVGDELKVIERAVVYDPARSLVGSGGQLSGTLCGEWKDVEFWSRWEGETREAYEKRKQQIIAELNKKNLPVDPFDSFIGENSIQGTWSKPNVGPAFVLESHQSDLRLPIDGDSLEVQIFDDEKRRYGVYLAKAQRIFHAIPVSDRVVLQDGKVETHGGSRIRYSPPLYPFTTWIRYRVIASKGEPAKVLEDGELVSEWSPGPHFQPWSFEQHRQLVRQVRDINQKLYEDGQVHVREYSKSESDIRVRLVRLSDELAKAPITDFESRLDPGGQGAFFRGLWVKFLSAEIDILQRALRVDRQDQIEKIADSEAKGDGQGFVDSEASNRTPTIKNQSTVHDATLEGEDYLFSVRDLYELLKGLEKQLTYPTLKKRLLRTLVIEGVSIEVKMIGRRKLISKRSYDAVKRSISLRLEGAAGWKNN